MKIRIDSSLQNRFNLMNLVKLRSKKSQLTLFVILSIVLILLFIIAYFVISNSYQNNEKNNVVQEELKNDPVYAVVYDCLKSTSKEAIVTIGEHGGLADLKRLDFRFGEDATNSDAVILASKNTKAYSIAKDAREAVPYYWFMSSQTGCTTDCTFNIFFPNLYHGESSPTIEDEIDYYINNKIGECINNFTILKERGFSFSKISKPKSETRINAKTISITLTMPIEAKLGVADYKFDKFEVSHQIDFESIYDMSKEILGAEGTYRFLELMSLNVISDYASINGEIPPMADSTFKFGSLGTFWVKSKVKKNVQDLLSSNTPLLRAYNSKNYVTLGTTDFTKKLMDSQLAINLSREYNLDVNFNYAPWWGFYFDLNCDGELCKPESFSNTFSVLVGNQRYKFYYTYSYPVLVKIHDANAFNGEGYDYYFFLENNVRYGEILSEGDYAFADWLTSQTTDFLCEEDQKNSGNYSMSFKNSVTNLPLTDVTTFYTCGDTTCTIGTSGTADYSTKLPICAPGRISFIKDGFVSKDIQVLTDLNVSANLGIVALEPIRKKNLSITKMKFVKSGSEWKESGEGELKPNQEAIVTFSRDAATDEQKMTQVVVFNYTHQSEQISIVPGVFKVSVLLLDKNKIEIPQEEREISSLFTSQKYTVPGVLFNETSPFVLGGLEGNYTVLSDIDKASKVVLNVIAFEMGEVPPSNRKIEDLSIMGQVYNYSTMYYDRLGFFAR